MSMSDGADTRPRDDAARWVADEEMPTPAPGVADDANDDALALRTEIARTQAELSETVDTLQERLQPQRLMEQARDTMQETTERVVDQARETVHDATIGRVEQMASEVGETARQTGSGLMETIRRNPVPTALVAVGLGWLWTHRAQEPSRQTQQVVRYRLDDADRYGAGYGYGTGGERSRAQPGPGVGDQARGALDAARDTTGQALNNAQDTAGQALSAAQDTAGQAAARVQQTAGDVVEGTQRQAQRAQGQMERLMQDSPLAVGAIGVALGVAVGLAVPETQPEQQLLGPARDTVLDRAQQAAQGTMDKVQRVAQEAGNSAREAAQRQGLTG